MRSWPTARASQGPGGSSDASGRSCFTLKRLIKAFQWEDPTFVQRFSTVLQRITWPLEHILPFAPYLSRADTRSLRTT
jgi:hypothetical protein